MFPAPQVGDDNRAFWTGGREGELRILRCSECGYYIHPPAPRCPKCLSEDVEPRSVSGRGNVYTFTINRRAWSPGLEVPYVIAIVQLDEQADLRLMTNVVGCAADEVAIGMPVQVEFREQGKAFVPVFGPAGAAKAPPSGAADQSAKAPPSGAADQSAKAPPSGAADQSAKAPPSGAADQSR